MTVSWFGPKNQASFGLLVASQNRRREVDAGQASKSSGLLRMKTSLASVSQSGLKTAEARRQVVHVTPSQRLRQRQVEDECVNVTGCVGPCYPIFTVFNVLGRRGIVVIYLFTWVYIYDPKVDRVPCHFSILFLLCLE
jgi:hypothetical protein